MWSAPQRRVAADGTEYHIVRCSFPLLLLQPAPRPFSRICFCLQVLLDTEGIDAYDQVRAPANAAPATMHGQLTRGSRVDPHRPSRARPHHLFLPTACFLLPQTAQYSTQIFSLAVLLSSLFIYNQMGGIDESALDRLSLVTEMTKHIRVKAGKADDAGVGNLGDFAPSFLWLLRDFYLKLEQDGRWVPVPTRLQVPSPSHHLHHDRLSSK